MTDLSALSDDDLRAIANGDMRSVSDEGLRLLAGEKKERSFGEEVGRQFQLAARSGIKGAVGLGSLLADTGVSLANIAGAGLPMPSQSLDEMLSRFLPKPETRIERGAAAITEGGTGAATGAGLFRGAANALPRGATSGNVFQLLSRDPGAQAAAAGTGALATTEAREQGYGPGAQVGLGILGSVAGGAAAGTTSALTAPLRSSGREQIIGRLLREVSANPTTAIQRLENAPRFLPGSAPTIFSASKDPGISGIRNFLSSMDQHGLLGGLENQNQLARMQAIDRITRMPRQSAINAIGSRADDLFAKAKPVNPLRVIDEIQTMRADPRYAAASDVLASAEAQMNKLAAAGQNLESAETLWRGLRMKLNEWIGRRAAPFGESARGLDGQELRALGELKSRVDDILSDAVPGLSEKFLKPYSKLMAARERGELLESLAMRATATGQKVVTEQEDLLAMTAGKWNQAVKTMLSSGEMGKLTPTQRETVQRITQDFVAHLPIAGNRPAGSDTFKNMTVAAVLGRIIGAGEVTQGPKWARDLATSYGSLLSKLTEPKLQALLVDASLDPALAAKLMRQADPLLAHSVAKDLARRANAYGYGIATAQEK